jgi:hypothetical protein
MLALSNFVHNFYHIITTSSFFHKNKNHTNLLPLLLHILSCLGPLSHCTLIAMWFYNQFYIFHPPSLYSLLYKTLTTSTYKTKPCTSRKCFYYSLSLHHLFFFIYLLLNCSIIGAIYIHCIPLTSLGIIPSSLIISTITSRNHRYVPNSFKTPNRCQYPSSLTFSHSDSSNTEKLCYLTAWQSVTKENLKIMNFSPGSTPICINTGASCSISNNKTDFLDFTPSANVVLRGIGSGLPIEGRGTLVWSITDDNRHDIALPLPNCSYVPTIPMCLLSPQHIAQQTKIC